MKKLLFTLTALTISLCFMGCGEDEDNSGAINRKHNYFDFAKGNYYIYEYNLLDSTGKIIQGSKKTDSLLIEEAEQDDAKTEYDAELYSDGAELKDIDFYVENYDLYLEGMPYDDDYKDVADEWYILYGNRFDRNVWNYFTKISGMTYNDSTFTTSHNVNCYFDKLSNAFYGGDSVSAISYKVVRDRSTKVYYRDSTLCYTQNTKRTIVFTFIEGKGLYKIYEEPYTVSIIRSGTKTQTTRKNGYSMILTGKGNIYK